MRLKLNIKKRNIKTVYPFLSFFFLFLLISVIYFLPPTFTVLLGSFQISIKIFFLTLVLLFLYSVLRIFISRTFHVCLISLFIVTLAIFIMNRLTHPLFFVLLLALFLILEIIFYSRKKIKD